MYKCGRCGGLIEKYDDIEIKIIDIGGYDHFQETCPLCNGDMRAGPMPGAEEEQ